MTEAISLVHKTFESNRQCSSFLRYIPAKGNHLILLVAPKYTSVYPCLILYAIMTHTCTNLAQYLSCLRQASIVTAMMLFLTYCKLTSYDYWHEDCIYKSKSESKKESKNKNKEIYHELSKMEPGKKPVLGQ
jgi:hypothetical protein